MAKTNAIEIRRKAFAEHVAGGKTGADAARAAGFTGTDQALAVTASRLMQRPDVTKLIREAAEKASKGRIISAQRRREILSEIAEGRTLHETTGTGQMGPTTQTRTPTAGERVAAIRNLNELDGLLVNHVKQDGKLEIIVRRGADAAAALQTKETE